MHFEPVLGDSGASLSDDLDFRLKLREDLQISGYRATVPSRCGIQCCCGYLRMQNLGFQTRLLVVDDEPVILETMTAILESQGFTVRTALDGFAALNILRVSQPDLVISDLRMPGMSGFEFLSIVRRRFPNIPVIAISGEYILEGMPPGLLMDAFFQKGGYTQVQLFETIKQLVANSPIRPHPPKWDKAPLWIPRRDAEYIVVTCTDCLRSFPVDDKSSGTEIHEVECPSCDTKVSYLVDSAVLKMLEQKKLRLPSQRP